MKGEISMKGFIAVTLQKITWASKAQGTSGVTWAYSNRKPQKKVSIFGNSGVNATISILKRGATQTATAVEDMCTVWLHDITDEEAQLYRAEYGDVAYVDNRDEDNPSLISSDEYQKLVTSSDDSAGDRAESFVE